MFCNLKCESVSLLFHLHFSSHLFLFTDQSGFFLDMYVHNNLPGFLLGDLPFPTKDLSTSPLEADIQVTPELFTVSLLFLSLYLFFLLFKCLSLKFVIWDQRKASPFPTPHQRLLFLLDNSKEWSEKTRAGWAALSYEHQGSRWSEAIFFSPPWSTAILMCSSYIKDKSCCSVHKREKKKKKIKNYHI